MSDTNIIYPEDERRVYPIDWREAFPDDILKEAETARNLKMAAFQQAPDKRGFSAVVMEGRSRYTVTAKNFPREEGRDFRHASYTCSCQRYSFFSFKCIHEARAMMSAEKIMGPFTVLEASYKWNQRKEENRLRRMREERLSRLTDASCKSVPALSVFQGWQNPLQM